METKKPHTDISDYTMDRGLPASLDAERAILGAILLDNRCFPQAGAMLSPDDFSLDSHRRIFKRMTQLINCNRAVDFVTLTELLGKHKEVEAVGGVAYVTSLTDGLPRVKNIEQYVGIVLDKSKLRSLIFSASSAVAEAYDQEQSASEIIATHQTEMIRMSLRDRKGIANVPDIARSVVMKAMAARAGTKGVDWLTTSLSDLDELGGIRDGEYIILAGRTSHGKSSFARQIAIANAKRFKAAKTKKKVAFFTFEMTAENLVECFACTESGVDFDDIRSGEFLTMEEMDRLARAATTISELTPDNLVIDESAGIDITELCARIRAQIMEGAALVIVDYLQLVRCAAYKDRYDKVTEISAMLRDLAKMLKVPIIALAQLKRPEQGRENREPTMFDLKECGNIENDAFQVWLIFRPKKRDEVTDRWVWSGEDWIIEEKNRNGPTGNVPVVYVGPTLQFKPRQFDPPPAPVKATPVKVIPQPQRTFHDRQDQD